jgi:hypothetical protein
MILSTSACSLSMLKLLQHNTITPLAACHITQPMALVTPHDSTRAGLKAPKLFAARYGSQAIMIND